MCYFVSSFNIRPTSLFCSSTTIVSLAFARRGRHRTNTNALTIHMRKLIWVLCCISVAVIIGFVATYTRPIATGEVSIHDETAAQLVSQSEVVETTLPESNEF